MNFSQRTNWNTDESELARAYRERLAAGLAIADLTASNPTRCGFTYPPDLLAPLANPSAFHYDPNPKGSLPARQAVCRYYADHGAHVEPSQVLLTTSTSEAYGYLFKLLCDPGDTIMVPQPSYPLFEFLADAEAVKLATTPTMYDHGWQLDLEVLSHRITAQTRAIVLVHPNNPTGHFTNPQEAAGIAAICREHGLSLIVDEVFLDYPLGPAQAGKSFATLELDIPVFIVSGISKISGLPQMKAAWLVALGPSSEAALSRLEVLADTYLSMNAPVQLALPVWLDGRAAIQNQIRERTVSNLAELDRQLARPTGGQIGGQTGGQADDQGLVSRLLAQGGWYAVLRIPSFQRDELTVRELLNLGVWVHPGYFFGMSNSGWLIVSLLTNLKEFSTGISVLLSYIHRNQGSY